MNPVSITEKMLYGTVLIKTEQGTGTGFFYCFDFDGFQIPVIFTNKHVVNFNQNQAVNFLIHIGEDGKPTGSNIEFDYSPNWMFHESLDLCLCLVWPILEMAKNELKIDLFFTSFGANDLPTPEQLQMLSAMEDVVMAGYPNGLWDEVNNFPLLRKGVTASHPCLDFNNPGIGVVDIAAFPGSSGSPIFVLNDNGFRDRYGCYHLGQSRFFLLGILFAGPVIDVHGEISIKEIPIRSQLMSESRFMINLGYYVNSKAINSFEKPLKELARSTGVNT